MSSFFDPYIGYVPTGQLVIGQDQTVNWEAIGFGANGRPNPMGTLTINLCQSGNKATLGTISMAVGDLLSVIKNNPNAPTKNFNLRFTEVAVCSGDDSGNTQEARMVILGSQIYLPAN